MVDDELAQELVKLAPDGLIVTDTEGRILFLNQEAERQFGYNRNEAVGQPAELLIPHSFHAMNGGHTFTGRRRDGSEFAAEVSLGPVQTSKGKFIAVSIRDVTDKRQFELAMAEAEERFRLAFEQAPIGMALVGLDGHFLRVNEALSRMVGYSSEELIGLTFQAITYPPDLNGDLLLLGKLYRNEIPNYQFAKRYVRKDGSLIDVMLSTSVVRTHEGTARYYIAQIEDISERKRAEAARLKSEAQFRELIERMPDSVMIHREGTIVYANQAFARALHYDRPSELIGKHIGELYDPASMSVVRGRLVEIQSFGQSLTPRELRMQRRDGTLLPVETVAFLMEFDALPSVIVLLRDLTIRKRAEEKLRKSEERLKRAQRVAHLGSWEWNIATNQVERSDELFALYGLKPSPEYKASFTFLRFLPSEDAEQLTSLLKQAVDSGVSFGMEHRIIRPDGTERTLLTQCEVISEQGRPVRLTGTSLDITDRKRAEQEREDALARLRTIIANCPAGIVIVEGERGERLESNRYLEDRYHHQAEPNQGIEQYIGVLRTSGNRPLALEQFPAYRALHGEHVIQEELVLKYPNEEPIPILVNAEPIRDRSGHITSAVVSLTDITPLKELERLRAEWNSVIAHDLRQPVTTIALHAELAAREAAATAPRVLNHVAQIKKNSDRLNRMIRDLLDLTRIDAHQLPLERRSMDLVAPLRDCVEGFNQNVPERAFGFQAKGELPPVCGDQDRLLQICDNLLTNAVKYSEPNSRIEVDIERVGDFLSVAVTNRGIGITPEEMPFLFQRFYRTRESKRKGIKGIGLGLYITRALVEAHGGEISVTSTPGETTTFRFTLPIARMH